MDVQSILFAGPSGVAGPHPDEPACFADLHLDQVVEAIVKGSEEYQLKPFFYVPLHDEAAVRYRHDILRDLERDAVHACIAAFAQQMRRVRSFLAQANKLHERYQQERWFLDAVDAYCGAVSTLATELAALPITSRGLQALRVYLTAYTASRPFTALLAETQQRYAELAEVTYTVLIRGSRVTVSRYSDEPDYSAEVEQTFARFQQGGVKDYRVKLSDAPDTNHVETQVLRLVARLYPEVFQALDAFYTRHRAFRDDTITTFDREVQFYLAALAYIQQLKAAGLPFCYPIVSAGSKEVFARDAFDIALANRFVPQGTTVVRNDLSLTGPERILVVTGPNQGGKTTFARMVGQLHYLASLGLPVPGSEAHLFLPDQIFTHFEKEEDLATLRGKLEDEVVRIHDILEQATASSIIIMNESFASTTLQDAVYLGTKVLREIIALGAFGVYVTFVDELASLGPATVSMVSAVVPDNPAVRTYKIARQPANGLAYAAALAQKYGLTYDDLRRRIGARSGAQ